MRVLLIWPNSRNEVLGWGDLGAIAEPLALEYLAAGAQQDGHEVRILDLRLHPDSLSAQLVDYAPEVVGVTAYSMHVRTALSICAFVKQQLPQCRTVVGGHHATLLPDDFKSPSIDFIVRGEGVVPFRALLGCLSLQQHNTFSIPGVLVRLGTNIFVGTDPDKHNIDELPLPNRQLTNDDRQHYYIDWMRPIALLRTSVGCPYRCNFCSLWKIMDGKYILDDADRVIRDLHNIDEHFIFLIDDEAFINKKRMLSLAESIRNAGIEKEYFAYCRVDTLIRNYDAVVAWKQVGLRRLFIGVDAFDDECLASYNKDYTADKIDQCFELAKQAGIEIFAQFVISPSYTHNDFKRLSRYIEHKRIRYPSFTVLTPIPGSSLLGNNFEGVMELQANGRPNWDLFDCQNAVTSTVLSKEEFRKQYRGLYRLFKSSYSQYREHVPFVSSALHDGDVGALTLSRAVKPIVNSGIGVF